MKPGGRFGLRALAVAALLSIIPATASASLRIDEFRLDLTLTSEGFLDVREQITVTFFSAHHGIERFVPVSYRNERTGTRQSIELDLEEVTMDGGDVPLQSSRRGSNLYIRIGDPDRTIAGQHEYTIRYRVARALLFREESIEIWWEVTGHGWQIPIDSTLAVVHLPEDVEPATVSTISYVGYSGSKSRGQPSILGPSGEFTFAAGTLVPGEGLSIALDIPRAGLEIEPPSVLSNILAFLRANLAAGIPLLTLIGMFTLWWRIGRDPRKRVIAPAFALPEDMHAGVAGVLIDDRIDIRDITGMIVGLAVKGHLRIEECGEPAARGDSLPADYRFVRCTGDSRNLSKTEMEVLGALFADDKEETTLSSLESRFYKFLPTIKSRLYASLIERGDYKSNPERTRGFYRWVALMAIALGAIAGVYWESPFFALMLALSGLIVLAFSPIMPRKTSRGVRAMEQVLGLSKYIRLAEVDRIEFHNAPEKTPETFERMLPYAIALNLTKVWTNQFSGLLKTPPDWYRGTAPVFRGHLFALSMGHLSAGMNRTLSSAPRTTSSGRGAWRGGSGFTGGFSGGGLGGGGGGGW